jgi:hypothetical protein
MSRRVNDLITLVRTRVLPDDMGDLRDRNRRTARMLLAVMMALAVAALLVGIRW